MDRLDKMTVVLASTQQKWHGGEEQARLLAQGLRDRGHRCLIFARSDGMFAKTMAAEGFETLTFPGRGRSPAAVWRIHRHLRRIRPSILHYNDSHALMSFGLASLGLWLRGRVAARRVIFALNSTIHYRCFCDRVICVSSQVAQVCRDGGIPARRIRVVHDGIVPCRVALGNRQRGRQALGISDDRRLLLTVAKLTDAKGHKFLLEALPAIIQKYPSLILVLAGDGELRDVLEEQARRLDISSHLLFLGYRTDVPDLIAAADLFVFPSVQEGFGSSLVDVMLAGVPIVTTTAGGIPDVTGSHDAASEPCTWSVEPGNPRVLAEAILQALSMPETVALYLDRAKRRARALFIADRMVEATLAVYREILQDRANTR